MLFVSPLHLLAGLHCEFLSVKMYVVAYACPLWGWMRGGGGESRGVSGRLRLLLYGVTFSFFLLIFLPFIYFLFFLLVLYCSHFLSPSADLLMVDLSLTDGISLSNLAIGGFYHFTPCCNS